MPRQLESRTEKAPRFVAELKRLHAREAFQDKPGADEQSQGERNLTDDKPIPRPSGRWWVATSSGTFFQRELNISARCLPGRPQSKKNCGQRRDQKRETKDRKIEGNLLEARNSFRPQSNQGVAQPHRDAKSERTAENRDQKTFEQKFTDNLDAGCADRSVNGKLSRSRCSARGEQIGEIGAGNEQDQSHRAE